MSQNELALQFFGAGFFNPQLADQALACIDMMDFDRKDFIMQKIAQNGGMYQQMLAMQQQMMMLAQMVDQCKGSNIADTLAAQVSLGAPLPLSRGNNFEVPEGEGKAEKESEPASTKNARRRVADSTSPV